MQQADGHSRSAPLMFLQQRGKVDETLGSGRTLHRLQRPGGRPSEGFGGGGGGHVHTSAAAATEMDDEMALMASMRDFVKIGSVNSERSDR